MRPHRRQPTRLCHPWDSPGKNTGVGCHILLQCMKVKSESEVAQSCPTPSDPMDCSLPGSSVHGIFQARVLEWGAIAFSDLLAQVLGKSWQLLYWQFSSVQLLIRVWLFATPWTAARQASLSPIPGACSNSCLSGRWCHPTIPSSDIPFSSCLQSFPASWSWSFSIGQFFTNWPKHGWHESFQWIFWTDFLSDWLAWSPCSPRDSQESSPTPQFKSINSLALSFLYGPTLTSIHDYWKNHSFD